jgi:hypothetical protein
MTPVILRLVCAWCRIVIRAGSPGAQTSHGMCAACRRRFEQDAA